MSGTQKTGLVVGFLAAVALGLGIGMTLNTPAVAQPSKNSGEANRFSVTETEGVSLIVTDNQKNTVFFYTVDEGDEPGADLHLRGTIDLNDVGQPTIRPTLIKPRKK